MLSLKKKLRTRKRRSSSSSSTYGSVNDLDDRVVMFCETMPSEGSFDSESLSPEVRSNCGSQSGDFELSTEERLSPVNSNKVSYRMAYYTDVVPAGTQAYYYNTQRSSQVYECSMLLVRNELMGVTADFLPHCECLKSKVPGLGLLHWLIHYCKNLFKTCKYTGSWIIIQWDTNRYKV